jgi:hypothetical protein
VLSLTLFECVVTLVIDRLGNPFCKGPSSASVKTFFKYIGSTSIVRG